MDFDTFRRIVASFADGPEDIDLAKGQLHVVVRDELIHATLSQPDGDLMVEENGDRLSARSWLVTRLARLPMLADRIVANVDAPECFVASSGEILPPDEFASGSGEARYEEDMAAAVMDTLGRSVPGMTSVWYLTADAGEGKTSLINHLAKKQARAYRRKEANWLLVPIPLGGSTFLRFDDVVVAALVNRLRFQLLYYEAFLELVRLGVVVPAFDGFEEVIIEGSSGEAISALGNLVQNLHSAGTVLMAARKAYFEYLSFRAQARLVDPIRGDYVAFGRLSLNRWDRRCFVEYARKRKVTDPESLYSTLAKTLPEENHPLLTRAVLASRVVDIAVESGNGLQDLLVQVGQRPEDYFFEFVRTIVQREASIKWLDRSGDPPRPLLTEDEHHQLLSMVAKEMWLCSADSLKYHRGGLADDEFDNVTFVARLFAENAEKTPDAARQILERLKQHALLVTTAGGRALAFDHEDFRHFYLGEALGRDLVEDDEQGAKALLEVATLPRGAVDQAAAHVRRRGADIEEVLRLLQRLATPQPPTSFVRENCGALTLAMVDGEESSPWTAAHMSFPDGALQGRSLYGLTVTDSHFLPSSLAGARLERCRFARCRLERLDGPPEEVQQTILDSCDIGSVMYEESEETVEVYAPEQVRSRLHRMGFTIESSDMPSPAPCREAPAELSEDLKLVQRALQIFLRSTAVNESTIDRKLGGKKNRFKHHVLPELLTSGILEEVPYLGHGSQRRFRLGVPIQRIQDALQAAAGLESFVQAAGTTT